MAHKIAISIHKGGTGKTVTAMALSAGLARAGKRTLLLDLDPQGHCSLGLGVELGEADYIITNLFRSPPQPVTKVMRETGVKGLYIVPSDIRLAPQAEHLYGHPRRADVLKAALTSVENEFEFIVMDCPPALGPFTDMALGAADLVLIPVQMEARATDALVDLLERITLIKGESFNNWRILRTRMDSRKTVTNEAVQAALEDWQGKLFETIIPQSEPLNQAQIERTDIFSFDPKSKGALAYEELTQELLKHF